jgi:Tfp pilus assembly protein PilF
MVSRSSFVSRFALVVAAVVLLPPAVGAPGAGPAVAGAAVVAGYRVPDDWRELLRVDDAMRRYFAARVPRVGSSRGQLDAIVAAILDADGLNFAYREDGNFDARETFRRRQGNCVAFSILVVAVAREYRLTARFNEIRTDPRWDRIGQVVAEVRHLNVVVRTDTGKVMVDLLPVAGYGVIESSAREVPDARAFAMFYSNNGVYLLGQARPVEALPLLERATVIAPSFALGWVNLGHAHSLLGDRAKAQACYERALKEEPANLKALASLAQLYRSTGQSERAQALDRKTERFRERNPYYLAALARRDLAAGDVAAAERWLRRALAIKGDEPEFYELAIAAARALGRAKDAERWAVRLAALRARSRVSSDADTMPAQAGPAPAGP